MSTLTPPQIPDVKSILNKLIKDEKITLLLFGKPIEDFDLISELIQAGELSDGKHN